MLRAGSKFYFSKLTDGEKNLYNNITGALGRFDPALSVHAGMGKPFAVDIQKILNYVLLDNPGYFYLNKNYVIKQTPMYIQLCLQYDYTQTEAEKLSGDEKTGAEIVLKSLEAPVRQIVDNAGLEGAVIVNAMKEKEKGTGFDALTEKFVDMVKAGIIDPTKVARTALQNATSVAATLLTTEAVVTDIKEPEPPMPPGGGMGMM